MLACLHKVEKHNDANVSRAVPERPRLLPSPEFDANRERVATHFRLKAVFISPLRDPSDLDTVEVLRPRGHDDSNPLASPFLPE
jgi:hypothetical protein